MFDLVKQQVSLIKEIEKDLGVTLRPLGEKNWKIDGGKEFEACPFCSHHDCFSVKYEESDPGSSFYKCFSCGKHGDVVTWRSEQKKITVGEALKELANEYSIRLPSNHNPIQQVFTLAADYYQKCLVETCNRPYPILNGLTPLRYQQEVRGHKLEIIESQKIGYSDGGLIEYLESVGINEEIIEKSGLKNKTSNRDFLPANCFIYPHMVRGRVSHFTFKDPLKRLQYQLPKKYSLNSYLFYGQDSFTPDSTVMLVEGENDRLSLLGAGMTSVAAIIGQISGEQIEWLKSNCKDKRIMTIFDPDDAGDGYRKKLEAVKKYFKGLVHVRPPEDKDIDEHIRLGASAGDLIRSNVVNVVLEEKKVSTKAEDILWSDIAPKAPLNPLSVILDNAPESGSSPITFALGNGAEIGEGMHMTGPAVPTVEQSQVKHRLPTTFEDESDNTHVEEGVAQDDGYIIQRRTHYSKVKEVKERTVETRISDFIMKLLNIYQDDDREQWREVILIRQDGYQSEPFLINSETKVTVKLFKIMVARYGDCEWSGREQDLDGVWRIVYNKFSGAPIKIASQVGRYEPQKCWIFRNLLITDSGVAVEPDENGVFWPNGKTLGIKPDNISSTENFECIPSLEIDLNREETGELLGEALAGMVRVLKDPGPALMAVGWIHSNVYSNSIFKFNGGMGSLMFWGTAGKGKSTLARWLQSFFGFKDKMASTSVQQLKSGIGFMRKAEYYASLPMFLDELRADEESSRYLGMIRSWYDREGRTIADRNDPKKIRNQKINATLMIAGEDMPEDPATKERCIMVRVPPNESTPELQNSYEHMESICEKFSNITYHWILDSCRVDHKDVLSEMRKLDAVLVANGCSNRISKVWSGAAYFALKLAEKYYPGYDFIGYLIRTGVNEHKAQKSDNTLARFIDYTEQLKGRENSVIGDGHISRDARDPNLINIWYSAVFKEVNDSIRDERQRFSKHAVLSAFREEPYFISDNRRVTMGVMQDRRTVLTLDLSKAPGQIQSLVGYDK